MSLIGKANRIFLDGSDAKESRMFVRLCGTAKWIQTQNREEHAGFSR